MLIWMQECHFGKSRESGYKYNHSMVVVAMHVHNKSLHLLSPAVFNGAYCLVGAFRITARATLWICHTNGPLAVTVTAVTKSRLCFIFLFIMKCIFLLPIYVLCIPNCKSEKACSNTEKYPHCPQHISGFWNVLTVEWQAKSAPTLPWHGKNNNNPYYYEGS